MEPNCLKYICWLVYLCDSYVYFILNWQYTIRHKPGRLLYLNMLFKVVSLWRRKTTCQCVTPGGRLYCPADDQSSNPKPLCHGQKLCRPRDLQARCHIRCIGCIRTPPPPHTHTPAALSDVMDIITFDHYHTVESSVKTNYIVMKFLLCRHVISTFSASNSSCKFL